jgi:hypothetical protein
MTRRLTKKREAGRVSSLRTAVSERSFAKYLGSITYSSDVRSFTPLDEARELATGRGGLCLSTAALNRKTRLTWRCSEGHSWVAQLGHVKRGTWCPHCAGTCSLTVADMRLLAAARGGSCLSDKYVNNSTPLQWRCSEGHEWWARAQDVRRTWCPYCAGTAKPKITDLRKIAISRGGKLLSRTYVNGREPLVWRCRSGHIWEAPASSVKPNGFHPGSWCPLCPRRMKGKPARLSI